MGNTGTVAVYADVYFIINMSMDALCLFLSSLILRRKVKIVRLAAASGAGAIFALAMLFVRVGNILSVLLSAASALLICLIAFGTDARTLFSSCCCFFASSFLLGGAMSAILSGLELSFSPDQSENSDEPARSAARIFAAIGAAMLCAAITYLSTKIASKRAKSANVDITFDDRSVRFEALVDSGNLLRDPLSLSPVVFTTGENIAALLGDMAAYLTPERICDAPDALKARVRFIPCKSEGGQRLVAAFLPDSICVCGQNCRACVALGQSGNDYGGYGGIVPDSIVI